MQCSLFDFKDLERNRDIPVAVYLPDSPKDILPIVIWGPGYQGQEELKREDPVYKSYTFLAEYFTKKGFAFISIQHDILGDSDGLETVDHTAIQDEARRHLYERGQANILFVIEQLKQKELPLNFNQIILGGHSNGGDITKYFINNNPSVAQKAILFDARRAKLKPQMPLSVLMFEADDTTTDSGVIADPIQGNNAMRANLDLKVIKPSGALHASYSDDFIDEKLKQNIFDCLDWFLKI